MRQARSGSELTPVVETGSSDSSTGTAARTKPMAVVRVEARKGWIPLSLHELWDYRELIYFLAWRDVKVRYKQTVLGAAWAVIQPLFAMVVFSLFFGRLAKVPSDGMPYPIFSYAALVPWTFFANGLNQATSSLMSSANLIKKVYFPRLAIPIASVLGSLVDFIVAFSVLVGLLIYYGVALTANALWIIPFLLLAFVTSLGVGLWLSALNAQFHDVRYVVPFLIQLWLFATPIIYPSSLLPQPWRTVYGINPMAGVVEGFRWALLGSGNPPRAFMAVSICVAAATLVAGAFYFRQVERTIADRV